MDIITIVFRYTRLMLTQKQKLGNIFNLLFISLKLQNGHKIEQLEIRA